MVRCKCKNGHPKDIDLDLRLSYMFKCANYFMFNIQHNEKGGGVYVWLIKHNLHFDNQ